MYPSQVSSFLKFLMNKILVIATAGLRSEQLDDATYTNHPRVDYIELHRYLNVHVLDYGVYNRTPLGRFYRYLETQVRSDLYLTWLGWLIQNRYHLVFTMSERAGIPFAVLRCLFPFKKPFVTMFQSWSERQEFVVTKLNLFNRMDAIAVHCQSMKNHLISLGAPENRIHILPYTIDQRFFTPLSNVEQTKGLIVAAGETRSRDYPTLIAAVENTPVHLVAAASGPWYAREKNHDLQVNLPKNVKLVQYLPRLELRKLYAQAHFVAVPVYDQIFSAGATSILEAGCMERAVIATRSRGILDFVVDGETGIVVEPGNVEAMREAICYLVAHPEVARQMGKNARARIEAQFTLENYVGKMAQLLQRHV
jgi:glycosyltransferase involved in cell wall biosynthesis